MKESIPNAPIAVRRASKIMGMMTYYFTIGGFVVSVAKIGEMCDDDGKGK